MQDYNTNEKLTKLSHVYSDIENKVTSLKQETCISCIQGCGDCCKRFEPYISVLEAIPLAKYLRENPEKRAKYNSNVNRNEKEWTACPFYDEDNDNHCTVYPIRPLICRLFGFSANRKSGQITFATCSKIQQHMPNEVSRAEHYAKLMKVPIYQDIAEQIQMIDFELATDYHPFSRSVEIAMKHYDEIASGNFSPQQKEKKEHDFSQLLRNKIRTGEVY